MPRAARPQRNSTERRPDWGLRLLLAAVLVAVTGFLIAAVIAVSDDESHPTELTLRLPGTEAAPSCLPFEVTTLSAMTTAFAGTVEEMRGPEVVVAVDRWFRSDAAEADVVRLVTADAGPAESVGDVQFAAGARYLLTATDGVVNGCGYSGLATPELEGTFVDAFDG